MHVNSVRRKHDKETYLRLAGAGAACIDSEGAEPADGRSHIRDGIPALAKRAEAAEAAARENAAAAQQAEGDAPASNHLGRQRINT